MSESYPVGVSQTLVRVSRGSEVLYQTGDMGEPVVGRSAALSPNNVEDSGEVRRAQIKGQALILFILPYRTSKGDVIVIETGAGMEPIHRVLRSLALTLLIGTPIILIAAALGGLDRK